VSGEGGLKDGAVVVDLDSLLDADVVLLLVDVVKSRYREARKQSVWRQDWLDLVAGGDERIHRAVAELTDAATRTAPPRAGGPARPVPPARAGPRDGGRRVRNRSRDR